jgi:hypothetical protein
MPNTTKSLALVWLLTLGLFVLTGSGVVAGSWLFLLVLIALAAPALILRSSARAVVTAGPGSLPTRRVR